MLGAECSSELVLLQNKKKQPCKNYCNINKSINTRGKKYLVIAYVVVVEGGGPTGE